MKKHRDETTSALKAVYETFAVIPKPTFIPSSYAGLSAAEIDSLLSTDLRDLTPEQLEDYLYDAFLTSGREQDFKYFFPRLLEINTHAEYIARFDWELLLGKLDLANWLQWPAMERDAITRFLTCIFDEALDLPPLYAANLVDALLCGLALARADLAPFLKRLAEPKFSPVLICYYKENAGSLKVGQLGNAYWPSDDSYREPIVSWFNSDEILTKILQHFSKWPE